MKLSKSRQFLAILFPEVLETTNISIYVKLLTNKIIIKRCACLLIRDLNLACCFCNKKYSPFS